MCLCVKLLFTFCWVLIIKISTNEAVPLVPQLDAYESPRDLVTESTAIPSEIPQVKFNTYVKVLNTLKKEITKRIVEEEGIMGMESANLPILTEIIYPYGSRPGLSRKYRLQTLKLLHAGLNSVKDNSVMSNPDHTSSYRSTEFPRRIRTSSPKNILDAKLLNQLLQRWKPRLDKPVKISNINNPGAQSRQDISVGLDLDTLTDMVDSRRRRVKLKSSLKKLSTIG